MSRISVNKASIDAIAEAIREKTGSTGTMTLSAMPAIIASISGGSSLPDGISEVASGSFVANSQTISVSTGLSGAAKGIAIWVDSSNVSQMYDTDTVVSALLVSSWVEFGEYRGNAYGVVQYRTYDEDSAKYTAKAVSASSMYTKFNSNGVVSTEANTPAPYYMGLSLHTDIKYNWVAWR